MPPVKAELFGCTLKICKAYSKVAPGLDKPVPRIFKVALNTLAPFFDAMHVICVSEWFWTTHSDLPKKTEAFGNLWYLTPKQDTEAGLKDSTKAVIQTEPGNGNDRKDRRPDDYQPCSVM